MHAAQGAATPAVVGASGSEAPGSTVPAVGAAGSVAVTPAVEKVPETPPEPASAPKGQKGRPKPRQEFVEARDVAVIRARADGTFGMLGFRAAGLESGTVLQVVGPDKGNGKRPVLGSATVLASAKKPGGRRGGAALQLDDAAFKAKGDRFVVLPTQPAEPPPQATEPEPASTPAPAAHAPSRTLTLRVKRESLLGLNKVFAIYNGEGRILSQCVGMLSGRRRHHFSLSKKNDDNKFSEGAFKPSADVPPIPEGRMRIECTEGSADILIQN